MEKINSYKELGLTTVYQEDADFRLLAGMLDGLAFLPVSDISAGMDLLRRIMPPLAQLLIDYFDLTYVSGAVTTGNGIRRPSIWNVHNITVNNVDVITTLQNRGFETLLNEKNHPSVWTCIKLLQADATSANGTLGRRRRRLGVQQMQWQLHDLCMEKDNEQWPLGQFLHAVCHNIRLNLVSSGR